MPTLRKLNPKVMELDSDTPREQASMAGGCFLVSIGLLLTIAVLSEAMDGGPLRWVAGGSLAVAGLGFWVLVGSILLQESYLLSATGISLRSNWAGWTRDRLLARREQIHCLALDCSDRLPLRWRLVLVYQRGQTLELAGYSLKETEQERWAEVCELGAQLAAILEVPFNSPQEEERKHSLEVLQGDPPTVHYPEFSQAVNQEIKGLLWLAFGLFGCVGLLLLLHKLGVL